ncbi:hypothetical protein PTKIN_Ptkin17bG0133700 [Pterospermum kingtungense]
MDRYSLGSSIASKAAATKAKDSADGEESGWTAYFEDFSNNNHHQNNSYCSSFSRTSSLISDAATNAAWKISHNNNHVFACSSTCVEPEKVPKKLRVKKTRTKEICEDDSLEDTASSPVNSPKVSDLKSSDMNPRKREDQVHSSLGKETASENYSKVQIEEEEEEKMKFDHGKKDCTELKKRGLCLVPFSLLVNSLG